MDAASSLVEVYSAPAMPRTAIPVVEVTAPDGTKSFWVAYSIPHHEAVAAVTHHLPRAHTAELSVRRLPPGLKFNGARPGDVIRLEFAPHSRRRSLNLTSARLVSRDLSDEALEGLDEIAAQLTAMVNSLPQGNQRQNILRKLRRLRIRMDALLRSLEINQSES
jgi:hypothetical protein